MRKSALLALFFLLIKTAVAQEQLPPASVLQESQIATVAEQPAVSVSLPDCHDTKLQNLTRGIINEYQSEQKATNIYQLRRQKLVSKNTKSFSAVDVKTFQPADNYNVANRMITLKMKYGWQNDAFRLCVGENELIGRQIYLLLYRQDDETHVDIINFLAEDNAEKPLGFIYE